MKKLAIGSFLLWSLLPLCAQNLVVIVSDPDGNAVGGAEVRLTKGGKAPASVFGRTSPTGEAIIPLSGGFSQGTNARLHVFAAVKGDQFSYDQDVTIDESYRIRVLLKSAASKPLRCSPKKTDDHLSSFPVGEIYYPSGYMGDIGDIVTVSAELGIFTFAYDVEGRGPHEFEYKYTKTGPAQFAGVMFLDPPNNWGMEAGWDLRKFRKAVTWEARCCPGDCNATKVQGCTLKTDFVIGGVRWVWDEQSKRQVDPLCPDSMSAVRKEVVLSEKWMRYSIPLSSLEMSAFDSVVGGFGWVINWGSNDIHLNGEGTGPVQPKRLRFQLRNIVYEKEP